MTEKEGQIDGERMARTEYTYDKSGNLAIVKNCLEDGKEPGGSSAQYVQYVYDAEGNKVRQFVGMTSPLEITVSEADGSVSEGDGDTFACAGKIYRKNE